MYRPRREPRRALDLPPARHLRPEGRRLAARHRRPRGPRTPRRALRPGAGGLRRNPGRPAERLAPPRRAPVLGTARAARRAPVPAACWQLFAGLPSDLREGSNDLASTARPGKPCCAGSSPTATSSSSTLRAASPPSSPRPSLSNDEPGFISLFASEMALVLVAALVLTALAARRLRGPWPHGPCRLSPSQRQPSSSTPSPSPATTRSSPSRWRSPPSARSLGGRYLVLAYASLGFGAAAKLVPALATLPLAFSVRGIVRGYAVFFGGGGGSSSEPPWCSGEAGFVGSFAYHADRGLQVESLAASVLMELGRVERRRLRVRRLRA